VDEVYEYSSSEVSGHFVLDEAYHFLLISTYAKVSQNIFLVFNF
jgi:hypothetical protein